MNCSARIGKYLAQAALAEKKRAKAKNKAEGKEDIKVKIRDYVEVSFNTFITFLSDEITNRDMENALKTDIFKYTPQLYLYTDSDTLTDLDYLDKTIQQQKVLRNSNSKPNPDPNSCPNTNTNTNTNTITNHDIYSDPNPDKTSNKSKLDNNSNNDNNNNIKVKVFTNCDHLQILQKHRPIYEDEVYEFLIATVQK